MPLAVNLDTLHLSSTVGGNGKVHQMTLNFSGDLCHSVDGILTFYNYFTDLDSHGFHSSLFLIYSYKYKYIELFHSLALKICLIIAVICSISHKHEDSIIHHLLSLDMHGHINNSIIILLLSLENAL